MWAGLLVLCLAFLPFECFAGSSEIGLLLAAHQPGSAATAGYLLASGADVNYSDSHGWTALMFASENGHVVVVKKLLGAGADVNYSGSYGWTALMLASENGRVVVTKKTSWGWRGLELFRQLWLESLNVCIRERSYCCCKRTFQGWS
jgi:hypothetical protein